VYRVGYGVPVRRTVQVQIVRQQVRCLLPTHHALFENTYTTRFRWDAEVGSRRRYGISGVVRNVLLVADSPPDCACRRFEWSVVLKQPLAMLRPRSHAGARHFVWRVGGKRDCFIVMKAK